VLDLPISFDITLFYDSQLFGNTPSGSRVYLNIILGNRLTNNPWQIPKQYTLTLLSMTNFGLESMLIVSDKNLFFNEIYLGNNFLF
jgi:hypothetical protein